MATWIAALVVAACVAASVRRLRIATAPTALDPQVIAVALRRASPTRVEALAALLADVLPEDAWERQLVAAVRASPDRRASEVNEQLGEMDRTLAEWARVPRVCASISASTGLLMASLALRGALTAAGDAPDKEAFEAAVFSALDPVALGIAGAVFCLAIHARAIRAARARRDGTDALVERLEAVLAGGAGAPAAGEVAGKVA